MDNSADNCRRWGYPRCGSHVIQTRYESYVPRSHPDRNDDGGAPEQRAVSPSDGEASPRPALTDRHLEILGHVAQGRTNRQVGELLGISERTVRNHMRTIAKRLASTDRTHSVVLAIGHGWISVPIEPEPDTSLPLARPHRPAESPS